MDQQRHTAHFTPEMSPHTHTHSDDSAAFPSSARKNTCKKTATLKLYFPHLDAVGFRMRCAYIT